MSIDDTVKLYENYCSGYAGQQRRVEQHKYFKDRPPVIVDGIISHSICDDCHNLYKLDLLQMIKDGTK
ncbi:MAG: hypothetical protein Q8O88_00790 [bacterium]|nr:hypothetical protein [bacterium]